MKMTSSYPEDFETQWKGKRDIVEIIVTRHIPLSFVNATGESNDGNRIERNNVKNTNNNLCTLCRSLNTGRYQEGKEDDLGCTRCGEIYLG